MDKSWISLIVLYVATLCLCVSGLGLAKHPHSFGDMLKNDANYQSWNDWVSKRNMGVSGATFGKYPQEKSKFVDWGSLFNAIRGKRELPSHPARFGNPLSVFTHGLQDWKNTFNGEKRTQ